MLRCLILYASNNTVDLHLTTLRCMHWTECFAAGANSSHLCLQDESVVCGKRMAEASYAPICSCSCDLCVLSCLLRRFGPILLLYASNININGNDTVIFCDPKKAYTNCSGVLSLHASLRPQGRVRMSNDPNSEDETTRT